MYSNPVTDKLDQIKQPYVSLTSNGVPGDTSISLSTGESLGAVQSVVWQLHVNELAKCTIETLATRAETKALLMNTTVKVIPFGNPLHWLWDYYLIKLKIKASSTFPSLFH